ALELVSPSDNPTTVRAKMQEYLDSGLRLGWLINPQDKQVEIYRPQQPPQILSAPAIISGESILPSFTLQLSWLWR
ncbi:Uma2 family endonuclease, partial [Nodosilinea sp. LEGE 07298]|uniref:Uma2 family endonuclease n=1 Tax=Nodosilinea sp. LEGE 07298 TaxID=2777970 RepID=UPI0018819B9C